MSNAGHHDLPDSTPSSAGEAKAPRRPYHKPGLRIYGDVAELTASAGGQVSPTADATPPAICGAISNYPGCRTS